MTVRPMKEQTVQLNKFMVKQFIRGVKYKYINLLIPNENTGVGITKVLESIEDNKVAGFFETMLRRSRAHVLQFKRICCIIIKFLECCEAEVNYMKYLKFNLNKLIVSAFVMSVANTGVTEGERIIQRDQCYSLYSEMTGLSVKELTSCCSIVRPVVVRRSRRQTLLLRQRQGRASNRRDSNDDMPQRYNRDAFSRSNHQPTDMIDGNNNNNNNTDPNNRHVLSLPHLTPTNIINTHLEMANNNQQSDYVTINPTLVLNDRTTNTNNNDNIPSFPDLFEGLIPPSPEDRSPTIYEDNSTSSSPYDRHSPQTSRHNKYNQRGNGYVLPNEIEQFNIMGQKLVRDYFKVV